MKNSYLKLITFAALLSGSQSYAQLSGTVSVPSIPKYPDLAAVVDSLNLYGLSGPVVINVTQNQTAPAGGYVLGTTGSKLNSGANSATASRTITINGAGNTITAPTGTGDADGVFSIAGVDYVTIDALHIQEPARTSQAEAMEWGYGLLRYQATLPYDGAQHTTIRNCTISLNRIGAGVKGIYSANHTRAGATFPPMFGVSAVASDANSYNQFLNNTISNCIYGIHVLGLQASFDPSDMSTRLDVKNVIEGNVITVGGGQPAYGVYVGYDSTIHISRNRIQTVSNHAQAAYGIWIAGGKGNVQLNENTISLSSLTGSDFTGIHIANAQRENSGSLEVRGNTFADWNNTSGGTPVVFIMNNTGYFDTVNILNNIVRNINLTMSGFSSRHVRLFENKIGGPVSVLNFNDNRVNNVRVNRSSNAGSLIIAINSPVNSGTSGTFTISRNVFQNIEHQEGDLYGILIHGNSAKTSIVTHNKLDSLRVTSGAGAIRGFYSDAPSSGVSEVAYDTLSNSSTTAGGLFGYRNLFGTQSSLHHCVFQNLTTVTGKIYGVHYEGGGEFSAYSNNISRLSITGASGEIYGAYLAGFTTAFRFYNNMISGYHVQDVYNAANGLYGIYLGNQSGGGEPSVSRLYHNTIRIEPQVTNGSDLGATGVYYNDFNNLDLRNNIINVNVTPRGSGFTAALRRSEGVSGVPNAKFATTSNANIYYAPAAANSYIYAEGSSLANLQNTFSLATDPGFNTSCGLYKAFMAPRESGSFTENNLVAGALPQTWVPAGISFAEGIAVATTAPQVTLDYAGGIRAAEADAGALEFAGTTSGANPPVIAYTPLPGSVYCTNAAPSLQVSITGGNGGINTAPGSAPRIYFRKSSENDAFGNYPADNSSSFNGWKYVEAAGTAPSFIFTPNYALLTAPVAAGDSITYFVVAQDNSPSPNVTIRTAAVASGYCAAGVNFTAAAGPLSASPAPHGYRIEPLVFNTLSLNGNVCKDATTTLAISPLPPNATFRWQHDNNTGTFTDIQGATDSIFITPALDTSNNYRAVISLCNTTAISVPVHVSVTIPLVTDTFPARHCGAGSLTLGAEGSAGTTLKWYNVPSGGVPLDTGLTFTTPVISTTTTYYVSALNGNGGETMPSAVGDTRTPFGSWSAYSSYGQFFSVNSEVTINSVKTYLAADNPGKVYAGVWIYDMINTTNQPVIGTLDSFYVDGTMRAFTVPVGITLPVGRYKMTLVTSLGNFSSMYTTAGNYPYHSLSGAVTITGGGDANPNLADYYFLYDWSINAGCESPRLAVTAHIDTVAAIITSPGSSESFCAGDSVTLFASSNLGYEYQWLKNENAIPDAADAFYNTKEAGLYQVAVTNGSCADTSAAVEIIVNPLPEPAITTSGASGEELTTGAFQDYQWYRDDLEINGATGRTYTATADGKYSVRVTDANGCEGYSDSAEVTISLSIADATGRHGISVYPNPASGQVRILADIPVNASLMAIDGKLLWEGKAVSAIDIGHLVNGVYILRITDNAGRQLHMERLVKQGY